MSTLFDLFEDLLGIIFNETTSKYGDVLKKASDEQLEQEYKKQEQNNNEVAKTVIRKEMRQREK